MYEINVLIPEICRNCSRGLKRKMFKVFDSFEEGEFIFLNQDVSYLNELFLSRKDEIYNPNLFFDVIFEIFDEIIDRYSDESYLMVINALKMLFSSIARNLDLETYHEDSCILYEISDFDTWFQFLGDFYDLIEKIHTLHILIFNKIGQCGYHFNSISEEYHKYFEVMITDVDDYWDDQEVH
jgi:hypothetical protein